MAAIAVDVAGDRIGPRAVLPAGACLVHIGPHKTGTTSVQSAFHLARPSLAAHGVHYAGPDRHSVVAVRSAIDPRAGSGPRDRAGARWRDLAAEIARHRSERVVVSSEWFADADAAAIRRVVTDLDPERAHVAVTIRSLDRLLPSQWQQHVAAGLTIPYEPWLEAVFDAPDSASARAFWHRHRHDLLVERWASVVGPERVTVIVVDEVDRRAAMRAFGTMVGLPDGALVPEPDRANRSFTGPEAALMLAVNAALASEIKGTSLRQNLGLYGVGAAIRLRQPGPGEPPIETPAWVFERATAIAAEIVEGIERSGVRVIGDLSALAAPSDPPAQPSSAGPAGVDWPTIIARAGIGAVTATGLARVRRSSPPSAPTRDAVEPLPGAFDSPMAVLAPLSTERLRRVVFQRAVDAVRPRVRAIRRPSAPAGPAPSPSPRRDLTPAEAGAVARFRDAFDAEGLPRSLYDRVAREGVTPELERQDLDAMLVDPPPWPAIGAALVMGVIRASGILAGGAPGRRVPPPRAQTETIEVARVSTIAIALVVVRRAIAAVPRRIALAMSRRPEARTSP